MVIFIMVESVRNSPKISFVKFQGNFWFDSGSSLKRFANWSNFLCKPNSPPENSPFGFWVIEKKQWRVGRGYSRVVKLSAYKCINQYLVEVAGILKGQNL